MHATLPLAVHISANVLSDPCWVLGFVGVAAFLAIGLYRLREDEVARIGVVTAALFIASSIHVPLGPVSSIHLLLNGLAGVILGRRVCVAIPIATLLQAWLIGHGSLSTLGVNSCVMIVPALLARPLFHAMIGGERLGVGEGFLALACLANPWSLLVAGPLIFTARRLHVRLPRSVQAGFAIGFLVVLLTSLLQSAVLAFGGQADWTAVAVLSLAAHLPVAALEGVILATTVDVLLRMKPVLLLPEKKFALLSDAGRTCRQSMSQSEDTDDSADDAGGTAAIPGLLS